MTDLSNTVPRVPKRVAAVILNSLKGGVVPRIGLPYITVGRETEIRALLTDLSLIAVPGWTLRRRQELLAADHPHACHG